MKCPTKRHQWYYAIQDALNTVLLFTVRYSSLQFLEHIKKHKFFLLRKTLVVSMLLIDASQFVLVKVESAASTSIGVQALHGLPIKSNNLAICSALYPGLSSSNEVLSSGNSLSLLPPW